MQTEVSPAASVEVMLCATFADAASTAEGARALRLHFAQIGCMREAVVEAEEARITGLEVAAVLAALVLVARGTRELLGEVRLVVRELKKLSKELSVRDLDITVDGQPIDELSEEGLERHVAKRRRHAAAH